MALSLNTVPQPPSLIDDIRYTSSQIEFAKASGIDTSLWLTDPELVQDESNRANQKFAANWPNPEGFEWLEHLRIPYRVKTQDFSEAEYQEIVNSMNALSSYVDQCIEFFDDTIEQSYPSKYLLIRNTNEEGVYEDGCWSYVGFVNPVTFQNLNLGAGCVTRDTIQHEVLHALGFLHEQSRPDRDEHVDILWDNILPDYHAQFWKIPDDEWDGLKEFYDVKSVMHYEGWAFLTEEAAQAGNSSIVHKGTMDRFLSRPPTASASDIQQLMRRNPDYCQPRTDMIHCHEYGDWVDGDQYYFEWQACDGFDNCNNGNDEGFAVCQDLGCGKKMKVSGVPGDLDGIYVLDQQGYNNNRPIYKREDGMYLYSWTGNGNWHFSHNVDNGATGAWAPSDKCPTDKDWFRWNDEIDNWDINYDVQVQVYNEEDDLTDQEFCANNTIPVISGKRGKLLREGSNSVILRVNHPMSEEDNASLLVVFSRFFCGADFLNRLREGDIM